MAADADGTTPIEFEAESDGMITAQYANGAKLVMRPSVSKGRVIGRKDSVLAPFASKAMKAAEAGDAKKIVASNPKLIKNEKYDQIIGTDPVMHVRDFDCVRPGSNRFATRRQFATATWPACGRDQLKLGEGNLRSEEGTS